MIHVPAQFYKSFRGATAICVFLIFGFNYMILRAKRVQKDYAYITGKITYLDKKLGSNLGHDQDKYRYIKIANYAYPFEVEANEQAAKIDSNLSVGNVVTAWYNETEEDDVKTSELKFLEKNGKLIYKINTENTVMFGAVMMALQLLIILVYYKLYKKGKIGYWLTVK